MKYILHLIPWWLSLNKYVVLVGKCWSTTNSRATIWHSWEAHTWLLGCGGTRPSNGEWCFCVCCHVWGLRITLALFDWNWNLSHQVDFSGTVGDDFLEQLGLVKGIRKVVNHEERGKVLRALDGRSYKLSAGGSLSNTLVALARLGTASTQSRTLNVAMTGSVGSDALGDFYRCALQPFFLSLCWYQCDGRAWSQDSHLCSMVLWESYLLDSALQDKVATGRCALPVTTCSGWHYWYCHCFNHTWCPADYALLSSKALLFFQVETTLRSFLGRFQ
jgi:hypothetical protein